MAAGRCRKGSSRTPPGDVSDEEILECLLSILSGQAQLIGLWSGVRDVLLARYTVQVVGNDGPKRIA